MCASIPCCSITSQPSSGSSANANNARCSAAIIPSRQARRNRRCGANSRGQPARSALAEPFGSAAMSRFRSDEKDGKRIGPHRQMHLAHGKIVKAEGQLRRRIRIGLLLSRQADIETNAGRRGIAGATVRGFHNAGTAAGSDDVVGSPPSMVSAPPRSETSRPKARARSYHRVCLTRRLTYSHPGVPFASRSRVSACSGEGLCALPNTMIVESTPQSRSDNSALAYSSAKRTTRISSRSRSSGSSTGSR